MSEPPPDKPGPSGFKVQIIELPNRLRAKVGGKSGGAPGQIDPAAIARAQQQVELMRPAHAEQTQIDLTELLAAFTLARRHPDKPEHLRKVYKVAHGIMAVGRTFDYDLLTDIANAMNAYLADLVETGDVPNEGQLTVVGLHLDALQLVVREEMKGDGGDVGAALKSSLARARAKFQTRR